MKVVVASTNPVKIEASRLGFASVFKDEKIEVESVSVESGVGDQPMSDAETRQGATNRAGKAKGKVNADYWVGLEGGVELIGGEMFSFAWVAVKNNSMLRLSRTANFRLPDRVAEMITKGQELGFAMDEVYERKNSKHQEGAVGILSGGLISRMELYKPAVILALSSLLGES